MDGVTVELDASGDLDVEFTDATTAATKTMTISSGSITETWTIDFEPEEED